jgi:glycosyltransferase involved in cell wall biosynthesis
MKVSVIVPTYNRSAKLAETIESIKRNDFPKSEFEIIIVNDNSSDDTEEIVKRLVRGCKNIKYLRNAKNLGPAGARNRGIKISRGEFVFFTDDDCIVPKNWIKTYASFFEKHKNVAGIGGLLEPAAKNFIARMEMLKDRVLGLKADKIIISRSTPMGFTNNVAYRKEVFNSVGCFNEKFKIPGGEDPEFKSRAAGKFDLAFIPLVVKHNHSYNLDYILGITFKQGLEMKPPKSLLLKIILLALLSPLLVFNIIRKTIKYRFGKL